MSEPFKSRGGNGVPRVKVVEGAEEVEGRLYSPGQSPFLPLEPGRGWTGEIGTEM
jgi:hypothetical protein